MDRTSETFIASWNRTSATFWCSMPRDYDSGDLNSVSTELEDISSTLRDSQSGLERISRTLDDLHSAIKSQQEIIENAFSALKSAPVAVFWIVSWLVLLSSWQGSRLDRFTDRVWYHLSTAQHGKTPIFKKGRLIAIGGTHHLETRVVTTRKQQRDSAPQIVEGSLSRRALPRNGKTLNRRLCGQ